jgi:predicted DNA-binding transcriptional regulator AlpA
MSLIAHLEKETRVLRARDVAKLFQVTPQHVYKMAAGGRLPSFRLAGAIRFDPHELASWLAEFARRLNRHDQFATDICDIRTA